MSEIQEKPASSLTAQAAWILIAKVTSFALAIAVPLLLARKLDQTEFGLYKQVFLVIATANALLPFGFGMSAYYFLPRESERRGAVVLNILIFNAVVGLAAAAALFFFPNSLVWLFGDALMAGFAPALGLAVWLWIFSAFLETLVIANNEARLAMVFIVFSQLSKAVFFLSAAVLFGTVSSLIWAAVLQAALQTVILFVYAKRRFPELFRIFDFGLLKRQFAYTLPFGLSGWLHTGQTDAHNYFVSRRFTPADFAVYSVGCFELPLVGILAESVSSVLIPLMSRLSALEDKREIVETSSRVTRKLALIYFPLYAFLFVTADAFITTLFTATYQSSVPIFRINLTLLPFAILVLDPITRAYKEIGYFLLRLRLALFALMVPALWYATTNFGLLETSAVVVTFTVIERFLATIKIARTMNFQTKDLNLLRGVFRTVFATILSAAVLFAFYYLTNENLKNFFSGVAQNAFHYQKLSEFLGGAAFLAVCAALFAGIYLTLINLLGALESEDKQKLTNLLRKFFRFRKPEPDLRFEV
ncbi:MAG: oligosaccharide flippase family protein [Acidobacteriota bacterium]|nr:oligosaccharide flippase family protein [Acidobacteriota bacterium]